MVEISNNMLAAAVFASLVIVIAGTVITLNAGPKAGLSGFATSDTGNVSLTIADALNIRVDPGNGTIAFGTCTPRGASSYWCSSNDTTACDGVAGGNCTGDTTTPQFIRVENVGNVEASVNVTSSCTADTLIGGTSPLLQFVTTNCDGTGVGSWTNLGTNTLACSNITLGTGAFHLFANVTIPNDATGNNGPCGTTQTVLTFSAVQI